MVFFVCIQFFVVVSNLINNKSTRQRERKQVFVGLSSIQLYSKKLAHLVMQIYPYIHISLKQLRIPRDSLWVTGQFVAGQFVTDNSLRTIRRMDNSLQDNSSSDIRRNGIIQSYHCENRKLKHERADEGEVKRVLSGSKVTSARSCSRFLVLIFH